MSVCAGTGMSIAYTESAKHPFPHTLQKDRR